jgi:hypothetical protein
MSSIVIAGDTSGTCTLSANAVAGTTTLTLPTSSGALVVGASADISIPNPGTSGNVLTSNGSAWTSVAAVSFDAGTVLIFGQTSAPTGWTKLTNLDNYALRVVSGAASTGGSVAFTTAFASQTPAGTVGATTLTTAQMPSHTHTSTLPTFGGCAGYDGWGRRSSPTPTATLTSNSTGGGGSHDHSFTGTAINLAVQYVDVIRATKN